MNIWTNVLQVVPLALATVFIINLWIHFVSRWRKLGKWEWAIALTFTAYYVWAFWLVLEVFYP